MSAGIEITRTEHTPTQLRAIAVKCGDAKQTRRLLAIALVLEGASRAEAARQTGMDRQTLRDWVHRFNATGVDGLISRPPPGPTPKLTEAQMTELHQLVIKGPDPKIHKVGAGAVSIFAWKWPDASLYRGRNYHWQMARQDGTDPAETASISPEEGRGRAGLLKKLQQSPEGSLARNECRHAGQSGFKTRPGSDRKARSLTSGRR